MTKQILFEDDFNGTILDPIWAIRGTEYTDGMEHAKGDMRAVGMDNGEVMLKTILDPDQQAGPFGPWLNGHIWADVELQPPCWVSIRAQVHPYHGSHASGWLQSYGGYGIGDTEIDIYETFGVHQPNRIDGTNMWSNIYWREADTPEGEYLSRRSAVSDRSFLRQNSNVLSLRPNWSDKMLTYKVHWTKDFYRFYISNLPVAQFTDGLSVSPHFPVLSMLTRDYEVANQGYHKQGNQALIHTQPSIMYVDWIRAWRNR